MATTIARAHALLKREGKSPAAFLNEARRDLARYETVTVKQAAVTKIEPQAEGYRFGCADGSGGFASKVLLATGLLFISRSQGSADPPSGTVSAGIVWA